MQIASIILSLLLIIFISLYVRSIIQLRNIKMKPRAPSDELSDFLQDQREYGYSFVRVDPRSVMIRSPRGQ